MRKCLAFLLAVCLLVVPVLRPQRAAAVETGLITVAGGAIGTGGAAAGFAAGSVVLPVLGVVAAVLAAYGINVALTDASQEAGLTKTQYIYSKIGEFAEYTGVNTDAVIQGISQGVKVGSSGNILLDAAGGALVSQFMTWLFDTGAVVEAGGAGSDSVTVGDLQLLSTSTVGISEIGTTSEAYLSCTNPDLYYLALYTTSGRNMSVCVVGSADSVHSGTVTLTFKGSDTVVERPFNATIYGNSCFARVNISVHSPSNIPALPQFTNVQQVENYLRVTTLDWGSAGTVAPSDDVFTGNDTLWEENKDLLKPGEDQVTVVTPPDVLNPAGAAAGAGEYAITVPDYLSALAHAFDKAGEAEAAISVPLTNTVTGAKEEVSVQAAAVDTSASVAVDSDGFSGTTGLVDPEAEPSGNDVIDAMRVDISLKDVFPFSIPFNFFRLLELFVAAPAVPEWDFHYTFPIGEEGVPVDWHMDLTPYATWAVVIQWAVRVGWLATLASAAQRRIKF